ncbi:MAG: hypothetical protein J6U54_13295 [Clostridiales bacterium]|nr:hypothetical protein [Clostridiales bacterium]
MKNITAGIIGAAFGGIVGFCAGAYKSNKKVKQLQDEMNEMEMFYEEQIGKLEERMDEIAKKVESKTKYVIDNEEVETVDDMDFEDESYAQAVEKATGNKVVKMENKIHPMYEDEAMELIDSHKARLEEVWLFSCGTLTRGDKETPIVNASRLIGYEILNKLSDIPEEGNDEYDFPYFVYNENESAIYEIMKDDKTYREYMATV